MIIRLRETQRKPRDRLRVSGCWRPSHRGPENCVRELKYIAYAVCASRNPWARDSSFEKTAGRQEPVVCPYVSDKSVAQGGNQAISSGFGVT